MEFSERFTRLDPARWTTAYLPAWSSRASAAATYMTGTRGLELSIPPEHPLWCPGLHPTPLRVSGIHSANRSGPVGSTDAQQPFRDGLVVGEQQPTMLGFAPHHGTITVTCSAHLTGRSMFSAWMVGLEDRPERCGEICLVEVVGNTLIGGRAGIGQGIHRSATPPSARTSRPIRVRSMSPGPTRTGSTGSPAGSRSPSTATSPARRSRRRTTR